MTTTLLSLVIIWLAVLPGVLFIWAFEMLAGRWTTGIRGGLLRSVGYSAVFHILFLPLTYHLRAFYWDRIWEGMYVSPWVWVYIALYVVVPIALGLLAGWVVSNAKSVIPKKYRWVGYLVGRSPAPCAWDSLFGRASVSGWVRIHTKSGRSIVGFYGKGSYVAGYPETQDIYLSYIIEDNIDPTGLRKNGVNEQRGLLIRWDEVEYLELFSSDRSTKDG